MRNATSRALLAASMFASVLAISHRAGAYCRTSACGDRNGTLCVPKSSSDCGTPLSWASPCFGFSVQEDASSQVDLASAESLVEQAFEAWTTAVCASGAPPSMAVSNLGPVSCDEHEFNQNSGNANVIIFRDEIWPYAGQGNTLALTTVTYNLDSGEIFDADLEVNATSNLKLTTGLIGVQYDLLSILTHEAGHMLGIAHSDVQGATMTVEYFPGDVSLRTLGPDDVEAVCAAYPPDPSAGECDPTPRNGLQSSCGDAPNDDESCTCRLPGGPGHSPATPPGALVLLGAVLFVRRRS